MIRLVLIALFMMIVVCVGVYALWTIQVSQQDNLVADFKKTDSSLHRPGDSLKNAAAAGAFKRNSFHLPEVELAIKANAITGSIDSMKHELAFIANQKNFPSFSYPDDQRLLALKNRLADYNAFINEHFPGKTGIKAGDFISVSDVSRNGVTRSWEKYYFKNSSILAIITELAFIKTQVLKLQQKACN